MPRIATSLVLLTSLLAAGCSAPRESAAPKEQSTVASASPAPIAAGPPAHADASASTNLDTTPLSAADYALYASIMGGASAMLTTLTSADREALAFAKKVDAGSAKVTPQTEHLLAQARSLQHKDEELARLQGIEDRYLRVKAKVEAVIGENARPPAADDPVATENRLFLEAHRQTIERFQGILRDPLSRQAESGR